MSEINLSSEQFTNIYNVRKNIIEILSSINYDVSDYDNFSMNELNAMIQHNSLDFYVHKNKQNNESQAQESSTNATNATNATNPNNEILEIEEHMKSVDNIYIKFYEISSKTSKRLTPQNIEDMIDEYYYIRQILKPQDRLLIISNDDPNDTLLTYLKTLWETKKILVTIIGRKRLQFNILKHSMVPPHTILNIKETLQFKKTFNVIDDQNLPQISRFDPVALLLGMKPGQICKIIRTSKTAIHAPYYRVCVNY